MKKSYLVYQVDTFKGLTIVFEADTIELCKVFLKKEDYRIVECWKKN